MFKLFLLSSYYLVISSYFYSTNFYNRLHHKPLFLKSNEKIPEEYNHLKGEFNDLCQGNDDSINIRRLLEWSEIQALLGDELMSMDEIIEIINSVCTGIDDKTADLPDQMIKINEFIKINKKIDDLFEESDADIDENVNILEEDLNNNDIINDTIESIVYFDEDDIWNAEFDIESGLEKGFIKYLRQFYDANKAEVVAADDAKVGLSYEAFATWKDVLDLLEEGSLDKSCLKDLWSEALEYEASIATITNKNKDNGNKYRISFNTLLRLSLRLDQMLDDIEKALKNLSDDEVTEYHRNQFKLLTNDEGYMTWGDLINGQDIMELLNENFLTLEDLRTLWKALPKADDKNIKNDGGDLGGVIGVDSYVALNEAIDDKVQSFQD